MSRRRPTDGKIPAEAGDADSQGTDPQGTDPQGTDRVAAPLPDEQVQTVQVQSVQVQGVQIAGDQLPEAPEVPIHLVRGNASPEELSALIAVVAVLTRVEGDEGEGDPSGQGQGDRPSSGSRTYPRSRWSSPARMVRTTHPHGPGGWRASAFPRYRSNRPSGPLHTSG